MITDSEQKAWDNADWFVFTGIEPPAEDSGYYPEQLCNHGNPDTAYCDECHAEAERD